MSVHSHYRDDDGPRPERGSGLFALHPADPDDDRRWVTDRLAGGHAPGSVLIGSASWLLVALGGGLLFVSWSGQYAYLLLARHQVAPAAVASAMFDVGMIIFSLLALGLARAGKPARTERVLIMACAFGSAGMNYAASVVTSPRSVIAYVVPSLFLAIVVDRVIAVIRRHLRAEDASPWAAFGRFLLACTKLAGRVLLYTLRLGLDRKETARGLRQMVLNAAPLPAAPPPPVPQVVFHAPLPLDGAATARAGTKHAALLTLYRAHPAYGDRKLASQTAAELAPRAGLQAGTARTYINAELARRPS